MFCSAIYGQRACFLTAQGIVCLGAQHAAIGIPAVTGFGAAQQTLAVVLENTVQRPLADAVYAALGVITVFALVAIGVLASAYPALKGVFVVTVVLLFAPDHPGVFSQVALLGVFIPVSAIAVVGARYLRGGLVVAEDGLRSGMPLPWHFDTGIQHGGLFSQLRQVIVLDDALAVLVLCVSRTLVDQQGLRHVVVVLDPWADLHLFQPAQAIVAAAEYRFGGVAARFLHFQPGGEFLHAVPDEATQQRATVRAHGFVHASPDVIAEFADAGYCLAARCGGAESVLGAAAKPIVDVVRAADLHRWLTWLFDLAVLVGWFVEGIQLADPHILPDARLVPGFNPLGDQIAAYAERCGVRELRDAIRAEYLAACTPAVVAIVIGRGDVGLLRGLRTCIDRWVVVERLADEAACRVIA